MVCKIIAVAAVLCVATNAHAVAFAEVRITHITTGFYTTDRAHETITGSSDANWVVASTTAGPAPNVQSDGGIFGFFFGGPLGTVNFLEYTYTLTASDDGLPAIGPMSSICASSTPLFCVTSNHGFEVAGVQLVVGFLDPRLQGEPGKFVGGDIVSLRTNDDAIADHFTLSGVARAEGTFLQGFNLAYAFADGSPLSPVPEPETCALMLVGLAALGARVSTRSRGCGLKRGS